MFEDGEPQRVTAFTNERVAVSLGVLLDVSDSMRGQKMTDAGSAVEHFVADLLRIEDEAFIGLFNHRPRLASAWTRPPVVAQEPARRREADRRHGHLRRGGASRPRCSIAARGRAPRSW